MGVAARQKILSNLKNTVFSFKNLIGREFKDPVVQQEMHSLPYKLVELPDHSVGVEVKFSAILQLGVDYLSLKISKINICEYLNIN